MTIDNDTAANDSAESTEESAVASRVDIPVEAATDDSLLEDADPADMSSDGPGASRKDRRGSGRGRGRGRGRHRGGHGRMGRGDVRSALMIALLDGPGHGYELIKVLEEKSDGRWRPSPGSVYPLLQMLSDEGLVTADEIDGRRIYGLTDDGRRSAEEVLSTRGAPWQSIDSSDRQGDLRNASRDLHLATKQVGVTGSPEVVEQAVKILVQARKDLYQLLADA